METCVAVLVALLCVCVCEPAAQRDREPLSLEQRLTTLEHKVKLVIQSIDPERAAMDREYIQSQMEEQLNLTRHRMAKDNAEMAAQLTASQKQVEALQTRLSTSEDQVQSMQTRLEDLQSKSEVSPPTDLTVVEVTSESVELSWANERTVTAYLITYVPALGGLELNMRVPGDHKSATIRELKPDIEYLIHVHAVNADNKKSVPVSVRVATLKSCPGGWKTFGGRCYYRTTDHKSWQEARDYCLSQGAALVVINSPEEQVFLRGLRTKGNWWSWIGLTRSGGRWTWLDGTPLTTTYWASGYPGNDEDYNCAYYYHGADPGTWGNGPCSSTGRALCEK